MYWKETRCLKEFQENWGVSLGYRNYYRSQQRFSQSDAGPGIITCYHLLQAQSHPVILNDLWLSLALLSLPEEPKSRQSLTNWRSLGQMSKESRWDLSAPLQLPEGEARHLGLTKIGRTTKNDKCLLQYSHLSLQIYCILKTWVRS